MVKKCIVKYDELGNPIGLIEIKEFNDVKSFKDFENHCKENAVKESERRIKREEKEAAEKKSHNEAIEKLQKKANILELAVMYLLGIRDVKNVEDLFKGEDDDVFSDERPFIPGQVLTNIMHRVVEDRIDGLQFSFFPFFIYNSVVVVIRERIINRFLRHNCFVRFD